LDKVLPLDRQRIPPQLDSPQQLHNSNSNNLNKLHSEYQVPPLVILPPVEEHLVNHNNKQMHLVNNLDLARKLHLVLKLGVPHLLQLLQGEEHLGQVGL